MTDRPLVITHGGCPDGHCAAWLFHRHLGDQADYLSAKYGDTPPVVIGRPRVWIADFSWPSQEMLLLAKECGGRLTVLDHHVSAEPVLTGLNGWGKLGRFEKEPTVVFDMAHSGAYLTWRHLKDQGATDSVFADGNPPLLVQYVQDRDLWSWRLPDSRAISAAVNSYPRTFAAWNELHDLLSAAGGDGYWRLVREGQAILRLIDGEVRKACSNAVEMVIAGHKVLAVNTTVHHSEIGGQLAEGRPFGATFYDDLRRGLRVWSLRSREGGVKVNEIAAKFGGGGHAAASGFQTELSAPLFKVD